MSLSGCPVKNLRVLSRDGYNHLATARFTLCGQLVDEQWSEWPAGDWEELPERKCSSCERASGVAAASTTEPHKSTELLEAEHYARQAQRTTRTRLLAAVVRGLWAMGERRTTRRGRVLRALSHEVSKQVVR